MAESLSGQRSRLTCSRHALGETDANAEPFIVDQEKVVKISSHFQRGNRRRINLEVGTIGKRWKRAGQNRFLDLAGDAEFAADAFLFGGRASQLGGSLLHALLQRDIGLL